MSLWDTNSPKRFSRKCNSCIWAKMPRLLYPPTQKNQWFQSLFMCKIATLNCSIGFNIYILIWTVNQWDHMQPINWRVRNPTWKRCVWLLTIELYHYIYMALQISIIINQYNHYMDYDTMVEVDHIVIRVKFYLFVSN